MSEFEPERESTLRTTYDCPRCGSLQTVAANLHGVTLDVGELTLCMTCGAPVLFSDRDERPPKWLTLQEFIALDGAARDRVLRAMAAILTARPSLRERGITFRRW